MTPHGGEASLHCSGRVAEAVLLSRKYAVVRGAARASAGESATRVYIRPAYPYPALQRDMHRAALVVGARGFTSSQETGYYPLRPRRGRREQ